MDILDMDINLFYSHLWYKITVIKIELHPIKIVSKLY